MANLKLDVDSRGVWLSAPEGGDILQKEVSAFLKANGVRRYDIRAIEHLVRAEDKTIPLKIADRDMANEKDARVLVRIAQDNMSASILVDPPFPSKPWPDEDDVLMALREKKVVFGVDSDAIKDVLERRETEVYTDVAWGKPFTEGKDAHIELYVDPDKPFEVREDEKVDFWSRSTLVTVHPGQTVAVKHPLEPGTDGRTVIGGVLKAPAVKNVDFSFGEGLARDEDNPLALVAVIDGQLKSNRGRLVVLPELDVPGDVDFAVGSIDFTGAVRIRGSVREGFHVISQGNIDVHGMVEGAVIDCQGSVAVQGGVRGMGKGSIHAAGDITLSFADQATLRSGGSILAKKAILHSRLYAQDKVIVLGSGNKSQIAGGRVEAGMEVSCQVLGSEMGTKTEVVVGLPPEQIEKRRVLQAELKRCTENLERIEPNLAFLKNLEVAGQLDDQKRAMMMSLTKMKFQLQAALESMKLEAGELDFQLNEVRDRGIVRVKGICYAGVLISIRGIWYQVHEDCRYTSFVVDEKGRSIVLRPYDYVLAHEAD